MGIELDCSASVSLDGDHIETDEDLSFVVQPVGLVQVTKPLLEAGKPISGLLACQVLAPGGESHLHRPNVCSMHLSRPPATILTASYHAVICPFTRIAAVALEWLWVRNWRQGL